MDTHTYDFEEMKYVLSNITTIRLIDTKGYEIRNAVHDWIEMAKRENKHYDVSLEKIHIHPALVNDAIRVLATAIRNYEAVEELASQTLECKDVSTIWDNGTTIKEEIMKVHIRLMIVIQLDIKKKVKFVHFMFSLKTFSQRKWVLRVKLYSMRTVNGHNFKLKLLSCRKRDSVK